MSLRPDWIMSLDPHCWTIFGFIIVVGQTLGRSLASRS
jgi:hypothetical protein